MTTTVTHAPLALAAPLSPNQGLGEMVSTLVGSEILRIAGEIRALAESGPAGAQPDRRRFRAQAVPDSARARAGDRRALAAGQTNYPPSNGVPRAQARGRRFYRHALGLDYPPDAILVAGGARPLIYATFRAVLDPGDMVVYPVPSWNNNHYCHLVGARGVAVETAAANGFLPTAAALAPHLAGARLLALNSPLNPTGTGIRARRARRDRPARGRGEPAARSGASGRSS